MILLSSFTYAATISGSIYDLSINKAKNSIVEVNSNPKQRVVAVNGTYEFQLSQGIYSITAYYEKDNTKHTAEENITIIDDGTYVIDLFLYPDFNEELFDDINFDVQNPYKNNYSWVLLIVILVLLALFYIYKKSPKKIQEKKQNFSKDLSTIINLLEKNQGRITQRELRKHIPLSEAKISLMITELEAIGRVKKIKKGRGNIIILQK